MAHANSRMTRETLERMKRVDIQKICKDYGVRANMKTEALIELLLDTIHNSNMEPLHRPPPPRPQPPPASVTRRLSTRSRTASQATTIRTRGSSSRSFIVHGDNQQPSSSLYTSSTAVQTTSARARKAKETQLQLGVGRPTAASSTGARTLTRSLRTRASRSSRLAEEAIVEEQETQATTTTNATQTATLAGPSLPTVDIPDGHNTTDIASRLEALESLARTADLTSLSHSIKDINQQVAWLKHAYQEREDVIKHLQNELNDQRNEIANLRTQSCKVAQLEEQMACLFGGSQPSQQYLAPPAFISAGNKGKGVATRRVSVPLGNSDTNTIIPIQSTSGSAMATTTALPVASLPGPTATTLGKRHRDSTSSNMTGVIEDRESAKKLEKDLARQVLRPSKKRARLEEGGEAPGPSQESNESPSTAPTPSMVPSDIEGTPAPSGASAISSSRIPSAGTPPPMAHLPDYFTESLDDQLVQRKDPLAGVNPADFDLTSDAANFAAAYGADGYFPFTFMQGAATSTPRGDAGMGCGDLFDPDAEPFSPGSALREQQHGGSTLASFNPFGTRRIPSRTMPHTPTQVNNRVGERRPGNNAQLPHPATTLSSPLMGLEEDMFVTDRLAFDFHHDPATPQYHPSAYSNNGVAAGGSSMPMGGLQSQQKHYQQVSNGFTITGASAGMSTCVNMNGGSNFPAHMAATPMRTMTKTLYGTEIMDDRRFGDLGQDGVVGSSKATTAWIARMFQ